MGAYNTCAGANGEIEELLDWNIVPHLVDNFLQNTKFNYAANASPIMKF